MLLHIALYCWFLSQVFFFPSSGTVPMTEPIKCPHGKGPLFVRKITTVYVVSGRPVGQRETCGKGLRFGGFIFLICSVEVLTPGLLCVAWRRDLCKSTWGAVRAEQRAARMPVGLPSPGPSSVQSGGRLPYRFGFIGQQF